MISKKALAVSAAAFFLMFLLGIGSAGGAGKAASFRQAGPEATPLPGQSATDQAIRTAFQQAVEQNRSLILGFQLYDVVIDHIQYAQDGTTALLWLGLRDRQTGEVVATEPGLSIASNPDRSALGNPGGWSILLQTSPTFTDQLRALPKELLTQDITARFLEGSGAPQELMAGAPFSGYKLPWTAGLSKNMTNSIGHVFSVSGGLTSCPSTCRFAFDFADGTMFPMLAAKGGTVKSFKTTCPNFGTDCTNFLILQDESTIPTSYQVYYHMANETLPQRLRQVGAQVQQGEYIGDADDTGFSTGHHLHFHVYTSPNTADWSWGSSVDITFDDVPENGGRPRTCAEASQYPNLGPQCAPGSKYISGNTPAHPPSGTLDLPQDRETINSRTVRVSGSATDDIQITRILVTANYDGSWKTIDDIPAGMGPFAKDVDLCNANVPDGPVSLTVRIYDREGSLAPAIPVRQLIKNYSCIAPPQPPPSSVCTPSVTQVSLYTDPDFRGDCKVFDINNTTGYTADLFGAKLGDNYAASIQVGSSVVAVLYDRSEDVNAAVPQGRVETWDASDASFSDNRILNDQVSGLRVISRNLLPSKPVLKPIGNRLSGNAPSSTDSLVLAWAGGGGAKSFNVNLTGPGGSGTYITTTNSVSIGNLAAGSYSFTVTAVNPNGAASATTSFMVASGALPDGTPRGLPFSDNMESGAGDWVSTGLWRLAPVTVGSNPASNAWIFNNSTNYADSTYRAGDLTSPQIKLPLLGTYFLRFSYFTDVEDGNPYWDQRRVQVSANGGPFEDLLLLSDDHLEGGQKWLSSGPISLQRYAGKTIRVRFHFDTIDEFRNTGKGWAVDNVAVDTQGPDTWCADNNNTPENAQAISVGNTVSGVICPDHDFDYYRITARAGQSLRMDIDARTLSPASLLDSQLQLIDGDQRSVIAENDDENPGILLDSLLDYIFTRDGTYYIKVRAWDYPGSGGPGYTYKLNVRANVPIAPQSVALLYPSGQFVPQNTFPIEASAMDYDGGQVASVDFYWHGPDMRQGWVKLGSDTYGADGWTYNVNPALYGGVNGSAVFVRAVSRTGGTLGAVRWDLQADLTTPTSQMNPLPAQVNSTAVQLTWTADDAQGDIDHFDLEYQVNSGSGFSSWQPWTVRPLPGTLLSTWFVGAAGSSYNFRLRAVDHSGNAEAFPAGPEASVTLANTCLPDANEKGQSSDSAFAVARGVDYPAFNFCKLPEGTGDVDWVMFNAKAGEESLLMLTPLPGGGANFALALYDSSSRLLDNWQSADFGYGVSLRWKAPASGIYYLEIKPAQPGLSGTDMAYKVYYGPGVWISMPEIHR